jgi:hypothetical protein
MLEGTEPMKAITTEKSGIDTACIEGTMATRVTRGGADSVEGVRRECGTPTLPGRMQEHMTRPHASVQRKIRTRFKKMTHTFNPETIRTHLLVRSQKTPVMEYRS